jgi:hypothetical protein
MVNTQTVSAEERAKREQRAKAAAASALKAAQSSWGHGWDRLTEDMRRGEVCRRILGDMSGMESESPAAAVFCVALATEAMRVKV